MSILTLPNPAPFGPVWRKHWTVNEFHELFSLPTFASRRMILVEGEILDMPKPNPPHDYGIGQVEGALRNAFGKDFWVRVQIALVLNQSTDPLPDVAVVSGPRLQYAAAHPSAALLVVEVAESSLDYDLGDKANLYAAGGIPDYWVLDLNNRCLHIFRDPVAAQSEVFGFRYQTHVTHPQTDTVSPLHVLNATIAVADLLP